LRAVGVRRTLQMQPEWVRPGERVYKLIKGEFPNPNVPSKSKSRPLNITR
jgi:hypothetical protein